MSSSSIRFFSSVARRPLLSTAATTNVRTLATSTADEDLDVLIVGGGVVGAALAKVLSSTSSSLRIGLLERGPRPSEPPQENQPPHARAYALSPSSLQLLGPLEESLSDRMGYYDAMQVWNQDSPATLMFSHKDLHHNGQGNNVLGAVVEDKPLVYALWKKFGPNVQTWVDASIDQVELPTDDHELVRVAVKNDVDTSAIIKTRLLVAADGAQSTIRKACGIPWLGWDYGRTAVTFCVGLKDIQSKGIAYQRFLPDGPLALLPTWNKNYGTIVWSTTPQHARQLQQMSESELIQVLNDTLRVGPQRPPPLFDTSEDSVLSNIKYGTEQLLDGLHYGMTMSHWAERSDEAFSVPPSIDTIEGPRFGFDLSCRQARSYYSKRVALVGDAAHTVHPMAGQGLNLGLRDVKVLHDLIKQAHEAGMDVGMEHFLQQYQTTQQRHNSVMMAGIHALHNVFGSQNNLVHHAKSLGMNFVNFAGPIRRKLAAVAAGVE